MSLKELPPSDGLADGNEPCSRNENRGTHAAVGSRVLDLRDNTFAAVQRTGCAPERYAPAVPFKRALPRRTRFSSGRITQASQLAFLRTPSGTIIAPIQVSSKPGTGQARETGRLTLSFLLAGKSTSHALSLAQPRKPARDGSNARA